MAYYEVVIRTCASSSGEYEYSAPDSEGWADEADLVAAMYDGVDKMEEIGLGDGEWYEDLHGLVHGEPSRMFAARHANGSVTYHGIVERAEEV